MSGRPVPKSLDLGTPGSVKICVEISGAYGHGLGRDLGTPIGSSHGDLRVTE